MVSGNQWGVFAGPLSEPPYSRHDTEEEAREFGAELAAEMGRAFWVRPFDTQQFPVHNVNTSPLAVYTSQGD